MEHFWKRAVKETLLSAATATVLCLFAVALFAVIVRAYAPSDLTVTIVDQAIKAVCVFAGALVFVRRERALFKGAAAGAAAFLMTTLVFGCIGGFRFTAFWLAELLLTAVFGALGALCGAKLRKE